MYILSRGRKYKISEQAKSNKLAYHRKYMKEHYNKDKQKNVNLKKNHGITLDEYNAMFDRQSGKCAICKDDFPDRHGKSIHVDHDHATGAIRGLLCRQCNLMLGHARDNKAVLAGAIDYLD